MQKFPAEFVFIRRSGPRVNRRGGQGPHLYGMQGTHVYLCAGFINRRIERRVVVHFELAVELETALSGEGLPPETIEAAGEIAALCLQNFEALMVALCMACGRVGASDFFLRMKKLEGKDREPVDDKAGTFGIQLGFGIGQVAGAEMVEQEQVAALGEIVAPLVNAINGALDFGDFVIGGMRSTRAVFGMPELEIRQMLGDHGVHEFAMRLRGNGGGLRMPERRQAVVLPGDFFRREHRGLG